MSEITSRFRVVAMMSFTYNVAPLCVSWGGDYSKKLERMRELASEAEGLQESTEWRETTKKLQDMQKEWTSISKLGTRVAGVSKTVRRFRSACDHFFQRKSEEHKAAQATVKKITSQRMRLLNNWKP